MSGGYYNPGGPSYQPSPPDPYPQISNPFHNPQPNDGTQPYTNAFAPTPSYPRRASNMHYLSPEQIQAQEEARRLRDVQVGFPMYEGKGTKMKLLEMLNPEAERSVKRRKVPAMEVRYKPTEILSHHEKFSLPSSRPLNSAPVPSELTRARVPDWAALMADPENRRARTESGQRAGWFGEGGGLEKLVKEDDGEMEMEFKQEVQGEGRGMNMNVLSRWEDDIIWNENTIPKEIPRDVGADGIKRYAKVNEQLEKGDWLSQVIWSEAEAESAVWKDDSAVTNPRPTRRNQIPSLRHQQQNYDLVTGEPLDFLNLSQDHLYQQAGNVKHKKRETAIEISDIQHARPALKMQLPHYPITMTKQQTRRWHRPRMSFPINSAITFSELNKRNTKQEKAARRAGKPVHQILKTTADVSLTDKGKFCLIEYSEQYPPIMSGFGMGSNLVNYYRQHGNEEDDEHVNKLPLGETAILAEEEEEPIPLMYMEPGVTQQVLVNNLIRAPLWEHKPETTDFLVIKQTINNRIKYMIREIPHLFVAGQVLPNKKAVPNLKSKELGVYRRERFIYIVNRLLYKQRGMLVATQLTKWYPDDSKAERDQKQKEFLCRINGTSMYTIRLPENATNQNYKAYDDAIKNVEPTPEGAMLFEAHYAARRLQEDAGIVLEGKSAKESKMDNVAVAGAPDGDGEVRGNLDAEALEKALASWNLTKNYVNGTIGLRIKGHGSPFKQFVGFDLTLQGGGETDKRKGKKGGAQQTQNALSVQIICANARRVLGPPTEERATISREGDMVDSSKPSPSQEPKPPAPDDEDEDEGSDEEEDDEDEEDEEDDDASAIGYQELADQIETDDVENAEEEHLDMFEGTILTGKVLMITRKDPHGNALVECVRDPKVIKAYLHAKIREEVDMVDLADRQEVVRTIKASGKRPTFKALLKARLLKGLGKKQANLVRRQQTKKLKAPGTKKQRIPTCSVCKQPGHTKRQVQYCSGNPNAQEGSVAVPRIKVKVKTAAA